MAGVVLLIAWNIAGSALLRGPSGSAPAASAAPYVFTANDAGFTATFPGKPTRSVQTVGSTPAYTYTSTLSDHAVSVSYSPDFGSANLASAVTGIASSQKGGTVKSRTSLTYRGQPAEDAVITYPDGSMEVRVFTVGSSFYELLAVGGTEAAFAHDYNTLLSTFTLTSQSPVSSTTSVPPPPPSSAPSPPASSTAAASNVLPAPDGYTLEPGSGPLTPQDFDKTNGAGAASSVGFVSGYDVTYVDNATNELIESTLFTFTSSDDASGLVDALAGAAPSQGLSPTTSALSSIPGSLVLTSTKPGSDGFYVIDVLAQKGPTIMVVEYRSTSAPTGVPDVLSTAAVTQYGLL